MKNKVQKFIRHAKMLLAEDSSFVEWDSSKDFPGGSGDEEAFATIDGDAPDTEDSEEPVEPAESEDTAAVDEAGEVEETDDSEGDSSLMDGMNSLSKSIEEIKADGRVEPSEVVGIITQLMTMVDTLVHAKPKRSRKARDFNNKDELQKYLKEHPRADKSKHKVVENKGIPAKEKPDVAPKSVPEDGSESDEYDDDKESGVKMLKKIREIYEQDLPDYNLKLIAGKDGILDKAEIENAKDIKQKLVWLKDRIEKGIKESADICKMRPSVCSGNMGLTRNHMPQIMDKPVKELLNSSSESDRMKGQAAVDAGADPDDERSPMQVLLEDVQTEGTKVETGKVPVGQLKATQSEIKADKTYSMADAYMKGNEGLIKAMQNPIIISSDNHILDGHHRYSAMLTADPSYEMNVIRIGMSMKDFLMRSHEQPGVFRSDLDDNIISDDEPVDLGQGPTKINRKKKASTVIAMRLLRVAKLLVSE